MRAVVIYNTTVVKNLNKIRCSYSSYKLSDTVHCSTMLCNAIYSSGAWSPE